MTLNDMQNFENSLSNLNMKNIHNKSPESSKGKIVHMKTNKKTRNKSIQDPIKLEDKDTAELV